MEKLKEGRMEQTFSADGVVMVVMYFVVIIVPMFSARIALQSTSEKKNSRESNLRVCMTFD